MSQRTNPAATRRTTSRTTSGRNTPARKPSPPRATEPDAVCALISHVFDFEDFLDRYLDSSDNKWKSCKKQPCPNRYDTECTELIPVKFAKKIERIGQEEVIKGHIERTKGTPITPIASSSQQPIQRATTPPPITPKPEPPPSPEPEPPAIFPFSGSPSPHLPHRSPPPPSSPSSPGTEIAFYFDSDSDDNMSKALKAFDKVTLLKSDGSNWDTWYTRVELAAKSIRYDAYLEWNPNSTVSESGRIGTEEDKEKDSDLLNAVIGRLSDGILHSQNHTCRDSCTLCDVLMHPRSTIIWTQ